MGRRADSPSHGKSGLTALADRLCRPALVLAGLVARPKALRAYRAGIEAERQRAAAEVEAREAVRDRRLQAILEQMRKP